MALTSGVYDDHMFSRLRSLFRPTPRPAGERYAGARQDPYYPHECPEAEAIAAEWPNADAARREALADEAETLLSAAYRY